MKKIIFIFLIFVSDFCYSQTEQTIEWECVPFAFINANSVNVFHDERYNIGLPIMFRLTDFIFKNTVVTNITINTILVNNEMYVADTDSTTTMMTVTDTLIHYHLYFPLEIPETTRELYIGSIREK